MGMVASGSWTRRPSRLAVTVETDRPTYEPGETGEGAREGHGQRRQAGAGPSWRWPSPTRACCRSWASTPPIRCRRSTRRWGLGVDTRDHLEPAHPAARPRTGDGGEGGDGAAASEAGRVRSRFMATAFWQPGAGHPAPTAPPRSASRAPDNLTAFRVMAVAADAGERFGAGERALHGEEAPAGGAGAAALSRPWATHAQAAVLVHNNTDGAARR